MSIVLPQLPAGSAHWPKTEVLASEQTKQSWYAVYTRPRHERQVALQFEHRNLECFLPSYQSMRRWQDRRVMLELPLFPGYVFARFAPMSRVEVLKTPGVVRIIGFGHRLLPVPDHEIDALRNCVESKAKVRPHPFLTVGRRVRVIHGPLSRLEGILDRRSGSWRLVVSIQLINRSVAVELDLADVILAA